MNMAKVASINKDIAPCNAHINKLQHSKENHKKEAHFSTNNLTTTGTAGQHISISHSQDMALIRVKTNMELTIIPKVIIPNYISTQDLSLESMAISYQEFYLADPKL